MNSSGYSVKSIRVTVLRKTTTLTTTSTVASAAETANDAISPYVLGSHTSLCIIIVFVGVGGLALTVSLLFPRHGSGGSMFARRADFSSFNVLPRHKINSYHIKVGADLVQLIHVVLFVHSPLCVSQGLFTPSW